MNRKGVVSGHANAHITFMFPRLLALFILIPLIELYLLYLIGGQIGLFPTIGLVVVTGFIGASLARQQGFKVWRRIQSELNTGRMPAGELIDGLLVLIGGIVLLTPGLLTDLCGFALMVPRIRALVKTRIQRRFQITTDRHRPRQGPPPGKGEGEDFIDV